MPARLHDTSSGLPPRIRHPRFVIVVKAGLCINDERLHRTIDHDEV